MSHYFCLLWSLAALLSATSCFILYTRNVRWCMYNAQVNQNGSTVGPIFAFWKKSNFFTNFSFLHIWNWTLQYMGIMSASIVQQSSFHYPPFFFLLSNLHDFLFPTPWPRLHVLSSVFPAVFEVLGWRLYVGGGRRGTDRRGRWNWSVQRWHLRSWGHQWVMRKIYLKCVYIKLLYLRACTINAPILIHNYTFLMEFSFKKVV